jgi:hypothetical protein
MFKNYPADPSIVRISTAGYQLLLFFFPTSFRQEYGPHMIQVFRDTCLESHHGSGIRGIFGLWAFALFDWVKILIEEQSRRDVEMTRPKLIRLSGWALMMGPIALFIGLGDPAQYHSLLINVFGPPEDLSGFTTFRYISETVPLMLMISGLGLILFGFWGLSGTYQYRIGRFGGISLRLTTISSGLATLAGILSLTGADWWWLVFLLGLLGIFVFLTISGILMIRDKPMSRWNFIPLATGGWFLGTSVIGLLFGWDDNPFFLILPMLFSLLGLSLLGYVLQSDAEKPAFLENEN